VYELEGEIAEEEEDGEVPEVKCYNFEVREGGEHVRACAACAEEGQGSVNAGVDISDDVDVYNASDEEKEGKYEVGDDSEGSGGEGANAAATERREERDDECVSVVDGEAAARFAVELNVEVADVDDCKVV
jgi:hypothetical protein